MKIFLYNVVTVLIINRMLIMLTESRKRKSRNWEEEDYYDSDEDNFLDRTGTVERKREQRMKQAGKLEEKIETYNTLVVIYLTRLRLRDIFVQYCVHKFIFIKNIFCVISD